MAIILQTKVASHGSYKNPEMMDFIFQKLLYSGYSVLNAGLVVGFSNLFCGFIIPFSLSYRAGSPSESLVPLVRLLTLRTGRCS